MSDKDDMTWQADFNPLQWVMSVLYDAKTSETGCSNREFLFDSPPNPESLYQYRVIFHYFMKCTNTPESRKIMILMKDDNTHLYAVCNINGISDDVYNKYIRGEDEDGRS